MKEGCDLSCDMTQNGFTPDDHAPCRYHMQHGPSSFNRGFLLRAIHFKTKLQPLIIPQYLTATYRDGPHTTFWKGSAPGKERQ